MQLFINTVFAAILTLSFALTGNKPRPNKTIIERTVKPIILKSFSDIKLQAPLSNYDSEWADVRKAQAQISPEQEAHKKFWSRDFLLHLNQLTRDWVAAHNVPPRVLPDSSGYPVPNSQNPTALPRYPFANPPVASRVFAYISVAQHDALLVALHYKEKWGNGLATAKDASLKAESGLKKATYPAEEAAVLMSTINLLQAFFPAEKQAIEEKGTSVRLTLLQSGRYVLSDIIAGESIGRQVAEKVWAYAQADGMMEAQNRPFDLATTLKKRPNLGTLVWQSRQKPARPSIEPHFGTVRTWLFEQVAAMRPSSPPSVDSKEMATEIQTVKDYMERVNKPVMTTISEWADPEFTATPIGHWNRIAGDLIVGSELGLKNDLLAQATIFAHLNIALMDAAIVCWEAKHYYYYPRPSQIDPSIIPLIPLPNFPSYPSGHSTFSGAGATVLAHFFPNAAQNLWKMAETASESRIYAGLHFKMDCTAGMDIGKKIGQLAVEKLKMAKNE
jgi:hypothetical protein